MRLWPGLRPGPRWESTVCSPDRELDLGETEGIRGKGKAADGRRGEGRGREGPLKLCIAGSFLLPQSAPGIVCSEFAYCLSTVVLVGFSMIS